MAANNKILTSIDRTSNISMATSGVVSFSSSQQWLMSDRQASLHHNYDTGPWKKTLPRHPDGGRTQLYPNYMH